MHIRRAILAFIGALALASCAPVDATPTPTPQGPVTITLSRTVCFGFCPAYTVRITGEGEVTFVGERFVAARGEQHATIPRADVERLLARFDAIGFERLQGAYRANISDVPTYTITLARNGQTKSVVDYGGTSAGMPQSVRDLQDEIDRVANTARWVLRDGQPVRDRGER